MSKATNCAQITGAFACMYGEALVCTRDVTTIYYNVWVRDNVVIWKGMI